MTNLNSLLESLPRSILIEMKGLSKGSQSQNSKSNALIMENVNIYPILIPCQSLIIPAIYQANICAAQIEEGLLLIVRRCILNKSLITMQTRISLFDMLASHLFEEWGKYFLISAPPHFYIKAALEARRTLRNTTARDNPTLHFNIYAI